MDGILGAEDDDSSSKKTPPKKRAQPADTADGTTAAKRGKVDTASAPAAPTVPEGILKEAESLNLASQLKNLMNRPDVLARVPLLLFCERLLPYHTVLAEAVCLSWQPAISRVQIFLSPPLKMQLMLESLGREQIVDVLQADIGDQLQIWYAKQSSKIAKHSSCARLYHWFCTASR